MKVSRVISQRWHRATHPLSLFALKFHLGTFTRGGWAQWAITLAHEETLPKDMMRLERGPSGALVCHANVRLLGQERHAFSSFWRRAGVFVDLFSDQRVRPTRVTCDLNDAVRWDGPVMGFCSNRADSILVPDRGFYVNDGYARYRQPESALVPWAQRSDVMMWRGGANGYGQRSTPNMWVDDADLMQRVRLCLALVGRDKVDVKFAVKPKQRGEHIDRWRLAGIAGGFVEQSSWARQKFAFDIDGHSNAFSNFYTRLLMGCCVIKVASPFGYRQWYYRDLVPYEHYLPVAADLSDLDDVIEWCRSHDDACEEIARHGYRFAMARTVASEKARSIEALNAAGL